MNEMISSPPRTAQASGHRRSLGRAARIIDISLELDASKFRMRTYEGFRKDMQFETEVIKDYANGGLGQLVRGVHMRLHAGTHVDAPSHMVKGGKDIHDLKLTTFVGPAMVADVRHRGPKEAIVGEQSRKERRRTVPARATGSCCGPTSTQEYDGSPEWMAARPISATTPWPGASSAAFQSSGSISITAPSPQVDPKSSTSRKLHEREILTMPYLTNSPRSPSRASPYLAAAQDEECAKRPPIRAIAIEESNLQAQIHQQSKRLVRSKIGLSIFKLGDRRTRERLNRLVALFFCH